MIVRSNKVVRAKLACMVILMVLGQVLWFCCGCANLQRSENDAKRQKAVPSMRAHLGISHEQVGRLKKELDTLKQGGGTLASSFALVGVDPMQARAGAVGAVVNVLSHPTLAVFLVQLNERESLQLTATRRVKRVDGLAVYSGEWILRGAQIISSK